MPSAHTPLKFNTSHVARDSCIRKLCKSKRSETCMPTAQIEIYSVAHFIIIIIFSFFHSISFFYRSFLILCVMFARESFNLWNAFRNCAVPYPLCEFNAMSIFSMYLCVCARSLSLLSIFSFISPEWRLPGCLLNWEGGCIDIIIIIKWKEKLFQYISRSTKA